MRIRGAQTRAQTTPGVAFSAFHDDHLLDDVGIEAGPARDGLDLEASLARRDVRRRRLPFA